MYSFLESKAKILFPLILSLFITASYAPTFSGEFILDDKPLVKDNLFIREFAGPLTYLSHEDGVSNVSPAGYHTGYYRPLVNLFYTLDYKIWGMKPSGFRITNLILHLLTCIILYKLLFTALNGRFIAFGVTLLFGLHPVNTESVAFISARNNILVALFSLISLYFYSIAGVKKIWVGILSYLSFLAAIFCKEFAIMLFPIFFLYNRLILDKGKVTRAEVFGYLPFFCMLLFYFILRANVIGSVLVPTSISNLWERIYFLPFLIIYNAKLILVPSRLHSFITNYPNDYLSWQAIAGFFIVGFLTLLLWKQKKNKVMLFSLLSFFIALFPALNIIPTAAVTKVSMRWLYFPMIFLSFCCAWYIQRLVALNRFLTLGTLTAVVFFLGTYSYLLNRNLWHDEEMFFRQEVLNFGNVFYAGGLAESYLDNKRYPEAERYFRVAIKQYPNEVKNYINYSALLIDIGQPHGALSLLDKATSLTMNHKERGEWHNNKGMAFFNLGETNRALKNFKKALVFLPNEPQFWANLGGLYGSLGDYKSSVSALNKGLQIAPESIQLRENLAVSYIRMEEYEKAVLTLEKIPTHEIEINKRLEDLIRLARDKLLEKNY